LLKVGRIRTLPGILHVPNMAINLKYLSKMSNGDVQTIFEKETYKLVQGAMALFRGTRIGTLYMLWEALLLMGIIVLMSLRVSMKKIGPLLCLERRQCFGIKH
jgi:hypothetical protein